ncbi:MAG: PDZ domain-containing protein [Acidobacteriia bacterium]|nr:PDZ domain-containing protein [Terriglobia bacterium]
MERLRFRPKSQKARFSLLHSARTVLLVAFAVPALAQQTPTAPSSLVQYTVSLANAGQHLVHVNVHISAGAAVHDLQLPVWNAVYQVRDFAQYVNWVRAKNHAGQPLSIRKLDKSRWHIEGTEQGADVDYEIFADDPGPFGAQLNEHHAFFNLAEVLMYPVDQRSSPIHLRFAGVPAGWQIAAALPQAATGEFSAENYDRLVDAPFEIGTFQESDFDQDGGHYRVVLDADPADYDLKKIVDTDRAVAAAEVAWMHNRPFQTYLFIYHFPRSPARGGMEHANCTAIDFSASRLAEDFPRFVGVTAHEFFHLWNVKRIRPQSLEPVDYARENYTSALWFSEGVTTTAADYALLNVGLLDEPRFLRQLATDITELEQAPAHLTQSAEESSLDAWLEKYDYYQLPRRSISYYTKGFLLGILLDLQIREDSRGTASLRDVFQWLNQNYAQKGRFFADSAGVRQAAEAVSHSDLAWFFQRYISGTDEIPWDDFFRTVGLRLVRTSKQVADPGFSIVRGFGVLPAVGEVVANSDAKKAGLATGDLILEINGKTAASDLRAVLEQLQPGDLLKLQVRTSTGDRELRWKVGAREQVEFQLKDVENIMREQRAHRTAWLRGESQGDAHP